MNIKKLQLRNYRNIAKLEIEFKKGINIIKGDNGQGKTNILESMVYLSLTRSHRINNDSALIKDGEMFADIRCSYEDGQEKDISAVISNRGKTLMIRRQPVSKTSEFIGLINVILFSPDDIYLFNDSPRERRKILNQEITKLSDKYLYALNDYQNLLKNKNLYLKQIDRDKIYLSTLNERMSLVEELIINERKTMIDEVNKYISTFYHHLSGDENSNVLINYACCIEGEVSKENILKMHNDDMEKDLEYHVSSNGIHREDMHFMLNGKPIVEVASQGQKRMIVLAFKLSLLQYIKHISGKEAILLLDDVLSELDHDKQKRLLEITSKYEQCIITTTEIPDVLKDMTYTEFTVSKGNII